LAVQITAELEKIKKEPVTENELQKVKNKTESMIAFEDMGVMSRANSLAYYEILGNADWMNEELGKYAAVTIADIQQQAQKIFRQENSNTLYYLSEN
jgi:zinc protease